MLLGDIQSVSVLGLLKTPQVFTRFLRKIDPLLDAVAAAQELMCWRNQVQSALAITTWTMICLSPWLVWVALWPLLISIGAGFLCYVPADVYEDHKVTQQHEETYEHMAVVLLRLNWILDTTMMIMDQVDSLRRYYSWHQRPQQVRQLLIRVCACSMGWIFVQMLVPFQYQCLVAGWSLMLMPTSVPEAIVSYMRSLDVRRSYFVSVPKFVQQLDLKKVSDKLESKSPEGKRMLEDRFGTHLPSPPQSRHVSISGSEMSLPSIALSEISKTTQYSEPSVNEIFENQRYWFGIGWRSQVLIDDPSPWSTEDGQSVDDPTEMSDQEWKIDMEKNEDSFGWMHGGHAWDDWKSNSHWWTVTRRRKWMRINNDSV